MSQYFMNYPEEIQLKIIDHTDVKTCTTLLQISRYVRRLTQYNLRQRLIKNELLMDKTENSGKYYVSFFSPNNKISNCEKFYFEIDSEVKDFNMKINLHKTIFKKNVFSEKITNLKEANGVEEVEISSNSIPLIISDEINKFKCNFAVIKKMEADAEKPRVKVLDLPFNINKTFGVQERLSSVYYEIGYKATKNEVEPPRWDYDYEVMENFSLDVQEICVNWCYMLYKCESL